MGRSTPQTQAKRRREQAKREKREAKNERRAARKADRESGVTDTSQDTADLASSATVSAIGNAGDSAEPAHADESATKT